MHHYDNQFAEDNVYGHVMALLGKFAPASGGLFVDVGCGFGRIAEVVRERSGLEYVGFDVDERALSSLASRGFETATLDLRASKDIVEGALRAHLRGRPVAALCAIDILEHLPEPTQVLHALHGIGRDIGAPLLLSLPNVAHRDVGLKLAMGRYDETDAGLLDHTHLQWFTAERLARVLRSCGWHQVHANDVLRHSSDQHFPAEHPLLSRAAPLHRLVAHLRASADAYDVVNQFVRAYLPGPSTSEASTVLAPSHGDADPPFLTVVVRTQGSRIATLREALLCLSAQSSQDFEVCVVGHDLDAQRQLAVERVIADLHDDMRGRVRLVRVAGGSRATPLNAGFADARGRYIAAFDDDDLLLGSWVETFEELARNSPGQILRQVAIAQDWDLVSLAASGTASRATGAMKPLYPESFDLFDHFVENRTPLHSVAFPRALFHDLHYHFDETLTTVEDWDYIMRAAPLTGVAASPSVGCIYRHWRNLHTSVLAHDDREWQSNYYHVLRKMDRLPLLLPAGSVQRLRDMAVEVARGMHRPLEVVNFDPQPDARVEQLRLQCHALRNSRSWRWTFPVRAIGRFLRGKRQPETDVRVWRMTASELEREIAAIEESTSWRVAGVLRKLSGRSTHRPA